MRFHFFHLPLIPSALWLILLATATLADPVRISDSGRIGPTVNSDFRTVSPGKTPGTVLLSNTPGPQISAATIGTGVLVHHRTPTNGALTATKWDFPARGASFVSAPRTAPRVTEIFGTAVISSSGSGNFGYAVNAAKDRNGRLRLTRWQLTNNTLTHTGGIGLAGGGVTSAAIARLSRNAVVVVNRLPNNRQQVEVWSAPITGPMTRLCQGPVSSGYQGQPAVLRITDTQAVTYASTQGDRILAELWELDTTSSPCRVSVLQTVERLMPGAGDLVATSIVGAPFLGTGPAELPGAFHLVATRAATERVHAISFYVREDRLQLGQTTAIGVSGTGIAGVMGLASSSGRTGTAIIGAAMYDDDGDLKVSSRTTRDARPLNSLRSSGPYEHTKQGAMVFSNGLISVIIDADNRIRLIRWRDE